MKLNNISLDQWQNLDNLAEMIEREGLNQVTGSQLYFRFSPILKVIENYNSTPSQNIPESGARLIEYCAALKEIFCAGEKHTNRCINKAPDEKEIVRLLKIICQLYPKFISDMADNNGFKNCASDNLYQKYYRHLQALWLKEQKIQVKKKPEQEDKEVYGNYTSDNEANFMTPAIRTLVNWEVSPENKGDRLIEENRLRHNLLSSQPLCFNLFGELKLHLDKALEFFNLLYYDYFKAIDNIIFEYNPARRDSRLTGDRSAFDVFVEYTSNTGKRGFIGIEVKYSETLKEGASEVNDILNKQFCDENRTRRERYEELSNGFFPSEKYNELEKLPFFQIWRDHLLAVSMCQAFPEQFDEGFFLFLSPHSNKLCREAALSYRKLLIDKGPIKTHFHLDWLEDYIDILHKVFNSDWTLQMAKRYIGREPIIPQRPHFMI